MKTGYMILSAASVIPLLSGCASYQKTADSEAWSIKPAFNVRHSTETPDAYYQLGRYYQGQNRHEQAITAYRKALSIDSTFAEARNGMGVNYAMQGKQQEALEQFRLAVKQAPNASHIHNNLGYALYLSGSYTEAASAMERAVALEPSNQAARTNLALALGKAGDRGKAVQVMAQAASQQPAENVPPVTQETQQARTGTPPPVPAPVTVTTAPPSPAQQQVLALPKDWGVITQAARKPVPLVENRTQAIQLAPNVYELRERVEVQVQAVPAAKPQQQAVVQPKERDRVAAQAVSATESRTQAAQTVPSRSHLPDNYNKTVRPELVEGQHRSGASGSTGSPRTVTGLPERAAGIAEQPTPTARPYKIEVSNGNGVTGMAKKVAGFLGSEGYSRARLTNQKPFQVASSLVQYRSGYREQAQSLVSTLPGQPGIAQADDLRGDISIRVVLGKDLAGNVAYFEQTQGKVRLVRHGSDS